MVQQVNLPTGDIAEFPDEMPQEQITQILRQQFPAPRPPRGGGQSDQPSNTSAGLVPSGSTDPFADIPTEIDGVTLSDDLRQAIRSGRDIEDPKQKRILAARIAGRIAAQSETGNLADQILSSQFGAGLRGFANGIFGLGDVSAAVATAAGSEELSFGDALELQREFRRSLEEDFPLTSGIAELSGILVSAGGVGAGGRLAARQLPGQLGTRATQAIALQPGQTAANIGRASAAGITAGGITEGILEGEPLQGAAFGAAGGPLGLAAGKVITVTGPAIKRLLDSPDARGIRALAKKLGEAPEEIARRFEEFKQAMGRNPSIADIANPQAAAELREIVTSSVTAGGIAREAAEEASQRRAGEISEAVTGGRVTTTQTTQQARRTARAQEQFAEAETDPIEFTGEQVADILSDPDFRRAMPASLRRRLDDALAGVAEGDAVTLTGLDVNDIRLALRDRARGATGADRIFGELANEVEAVARGQSEAFGRAIDEFSARSLRGEGVAAGRKVTSQPSSEFEAAVQEATSPNVAAGTRVGARSALADVAAEGSTRAAGLARSLSEDSGLVRRLRSIMPGDEVDRLQEIGRLQSRSAENIARISPPAQAEGGRAGKELLKDVANAVVLAGGNTGGAFKSSVIGRFFSRVFLGMRKSTIDSLTDAAFDPAKTGKVIDALKKAGVSDRDIISVYLKAVGARELAGAAEQPPI